MFRFKPARLFFFLLVFSGIILFLPLRAQQAYMRNFTVTDGLPSNEIYDIFRDSKGFLWFATDAGVSRYDGYTFTNFTSRDGLPDNAVFGFFEDHHGRIWFRSYGGLLAFFDGKKIVVPPVNAELKKKMNGQMSLSLYVDDGDTVWIGAEGSFAVIKVLPDLRTLYFDSATERHCLHIREQRPGVFFVSNKMVDMHPGPISLSAYGASAPLPVGEMKSNAYGLYCVRQNPHRIIFGFSDRHYTIDDREVTETHDSLPVIRMVSQDENRYWICLSQRKGIRLIRNEAGTKPVTERSLLGGYSVTDCVADHEGGTWFSTLERGVFYMPYSQIDMFVPALLTGEKITSMIEYKGVPVFGTSLGNIMRPDGRALDEILYADRPAYISCLYSGGTDLFVCAQRNSQVYHPQGGGISLVTDSSGMFPLYNASVYDEASFCAMGVRTVYRVYAENGKPEILCRFLPERMRCVCRGKGDTLWLGGLSGLWMLLPGKAPVSMASVDPLLGERIDYLFYDTVHDRLWMSSKGAGLLMKEGRHVRNFDRERPLIAATCRAIFADQEGNIWVATNGGAFCVTEKNGGFRVREFSSRNGLPSNDIAGICRSGDTVWIASSDRVFRFRLSDYPYNSHASPLYFDRISVYGYGEVSCDSVFSYNENTITFAFTGLSYKSLGQVHYRFRLIGADSTWKETESGELSFYSLPPGEYRFAVCAFNNDGVLSPPLEYSFVILPPFWKRWWFYTLAFVFVTGAIALLFRYRERRLRQREMFNQRLVEMEMTALRAQMNPHFIFNAINSIHNFVLQGDKNSSAAYLSKFSRLIRNVLENSAQKQITLAREIETLQLYIEIERMRFSEGFSFSISVDPSLNPARLAVVPLLLQPYVENAIWHGLLHKKGLGHLRITLTDAGEMISCEIDDDGIGREAASAYSQRRHIGGHSMGGDISLRRLQLLNEIYGMRFSRIYTDKKNEDGTAAGTRVVLHIPKIIKEENV